MSESQEGSLRYHLPRNGLETQRLDIQHYVLKACFDGQLLHPSITKRLPPNADILESGTGTGIWLIDLAQTPHLSIGSLTAFDLSPLQFPNEERRTIERGAMGEANLYLNLFEHDVTKALSEEHVGTYDLVHQRLLVLGLRTEEWPVAVANLAATIKLGGFLQLSEVLPGITDYGQSEAIDRAIALWKVAFEVGQKDLLCLCHLEGHLKSAGLQEVECWEVELLFGPKNRDEDLGLALTAWISNVLLQTWRAVHAVVSTHDLPDGIRTIEEAEVWHKEVSKHLNEVGGVAMFGMAVGRKA
ncbi:hypothetical protein RQP46_008713 [Phenoliferia psychrophenolica]